MKKVQYLSSFELSSINNLPSPVILSENHPDDFNTKHISTTK